MERLNLTLDESTSLALQRHAERRGLGRAALARELIREAIEQREARERHRKLAMDYVSGREDAAELLAELEAPQFDLLDEDE